MKLKLMIIICLITLSSCDVAPVDTYDPYYVYDGRGGIKCRANGELLKPKVSFSGTGAAADIQFVSWDNEDYLSIYFRDGGQSPDYISQSIRIKITNVTPQDVHVGDIFPLESELDSNSGKYSIYNIDYNYATNDQHTGQLEILYHDIENRILGGFFEYDAIDENDVIVEIRHGQFDMRY